jgi:indolepyruvate ferredoxin oxidoreductase
MEEIVPALKPANHAIAVELAALPEQIRGYGPIKAAAIDKAARRREELLQRFRSAGAARPATPAVAPARPPETVA